jgi:hypothetical protein
VIAGLQLAAELGGTLLSGPGGSLVLVERIGAHTAPRVAMLGRASADLQPALEAMALHHAEGLPLNLVGLLPLPGADLPAIFERERRRIGALVAALDGGLPWLGDRPMLVRALPGRLRGRGELAPLVPTSIQSFELRRHLGAEPDFLQPRWEEGHAAWWPGTPRPDASVVEVEPLELPTSSALADALRAALRAAVGGPIDFLPMPGDPSPLHALRVLTPESTAFHGPRAAWGEAFRRLAALPAPPHFCARC